jgi:hypothetical protein
VLPGVSNAETGHRTRAQAPAELARHPALTCLIAACADGARIGHDRRMDAAGGDAVIRFAHYETLMLLEILHRREQGQVTEPEHHAEQIALTRGYAWLADQILLQDRHR